MLAITALRFATAGLYELTASPTWEDIAGVTGLVLCGLALYAALAMALEDARRETSLRYCAATSGEHRWRETSTTSWPVSKEKPAYARSDGEDDDLVNAGRQRRAGFVGTKDPDLGGPDARAEQQRVERAQETPVACDDLHTGPFEQAHFVGA